eukprot:767984_1
MALSFLDSDNNNQISIMDADWKHLQESSINLTYQTTPQIRRSLRVIEIEAQRLSSKPTKQVSVSQLKAFAAQAGVNIQHQKQYITSIESIPTQKKTTQLNTPPSKTNTDC